MPRPGSPRALEVGVPRRPTGKLIETQVFGSGTVSEAGMSLRLRSERALLLAWVAGFCLNRGLPHSTLHRR